MAEKESALDALLKKHPNLSEDFRTLAKEDLYYSSLGRLITQSYDSHAQGNDQLLPGILDMIDSLMKEMPPVPTTVNSRYSNFISNYINYHNYQAHKHGNIAYDLRRLKQAMQEHRDLQVPDNLMQLIDHTLAMEARIKSREGKDTALVRTYHQNHEDIVKELEASVQKNSFMDLFQDRESEGRVGHHRPPCPIRFPKGFRLNPFHTLCTGTKPYPIAGQDITGSHKPYPHSGDCARPSSGSKTSTSANSKRPFDFQGSLKSNDIVAGLTDGNEILKRILAPLSRQK